jgi:hypothetical protein
MMTLDWKEEPIGKFWWAVGYYSRGNPEWRAGQAIFNVLARTRPDLSEQLRGTALDPFYLDDASTPEFQAICNWIDKNWAPQKSK